MFYKDKFLFLQTKIKLDETTKERNGHQCDKIEKNS